MILHKTTTNLQASGLLGIKGWVPLGMPAKCQSSAETERDRDIERERETRLPLERQSVSGYLLPLVGYFRFAA